MKDKTDYFIRIINSPIGKIIATAEHDSITNLDFIDDTEAYISSDNPLLLQLEKELFEYFEKKRKIFTLPLNPKGTQFQQGVWETLKTIPYGQTLSYAAEAQRFGSPKAVRAVANANGKNPISILIPCHRVISSSGKIGGYSGGIYKKEFLLALEKENE
ncbi:methylated-DNA--[protein]-cysteine S-methyltransferase [Sulfurimonas sp.]|uniref:methylated-DNA--[protein]-cysteine S-methyltransferase n=1 Tax=Sulfurimonas sp. TaxID=2022749 RepID=UPI0025D8D55A|nr:methylated-DNA--[protein]-cysteine S-methyltransferase [Sulfurimonas sp.]MDD5156631.1 methylated-DNA--[protein]-cysteine S-methyltransferase [Sulfurimonas sp.]